jgi:hypothetical protein
MSHLEIRLAYSRAGFRSWSVMLDGERQLRTFFSKREAVSTAERLARRMHLTIRRGPISANQIKRAAFEKRQQRVARRKAVQS